MAVMAGRRYGVAVCNGTVALDLALRLLDVRPGDEVIVPAMTYVATAAAVVLRGAIPVFADIEENWPTVCPKAVEDCLSSKTRLVMTMDYGGTPCAHEAIARIARAAGVRTLHDGAQSLAGTYRGRPLLSYGQLATTSFHVAKQLTTVEGGMVFLSHAARDTRARCLRNQGEIAGKKYWHSEIGSNYRISDLHAAIGLAQLKRAGALFQRRRALAAAYTRYLLEVPEVALPRERPAGQNGWFFYAIRVRNRDAVAAHLRQRGVDTRVAYPMAVYEQRAFRKWTGRRCPMAERFAREVLCLPLFDGMTMAQVRFVVLAIKEAVVASQ
jgi:perosamine synthetase